MTRKNSAPFDTILLYFLFLRRMVLFGIEIVHHLQKQEEIEMENQRRNGKDAEMTIIDGMPATVLTGSTRTPQPWED